MRSAGLTVRALLVAAGLSSSGCMLVFPVPNSGGGCRGESAGWYKAHDVVRLRASNDWDCPFASVRVAARTDTTFDTVGCGRSDTYSCEADAVAGCSLEDAAERESCEAASAAD
jgi:hypothetical protein